MNHLIIEVKNLSKKYILSHRLPYETFRDTITDLVKKPFHLLRGQEKIKKEEFWALKDINFCVNQGERIGIIGRNGAGKSTLLKILSQITHPTSGEVKLRGKVASLLEVGTGFHPELTGRENIYLNGAILGMKQIEITKKFDEIVAFAEIEKFIDTPVKRYSSGMYVRLAFAVAAHLEPEILIVDEVLAVGDTQFQKKCLGKMEEVGRSGRTILFVSHNLGAIATLCTKVIYLANGKIQLFGTPQEAIDAYTTSTPILSDSYNLNVPSVIRRGDGASRFMSIQLFDINGKTLNQVIEGKPFQIELRLHVNTTIIDLKILSITFIDQFGKDIFTTMHYDSLNLKLLKKGEYSFKIDFQPNIFSRGHYTVRLACLGTNFHEYDHIHNAVSLIIAPPEKDPDVLVPRPGIVRLPLTWKLK